ncbi:DMT family transporter [Paracoccus aurantiacus]|uniref:DMT family transporter n=1 Tax=Paracoccus aurantiacus TaxID=2599412 RepID=A0A5C6S7I5_9RHOB|nr:DMT family transporter [Paracoccus aurantiacus]TXB70406.1 DMT family transporter [Paracoccus aurantiacus]
MPVYELAAIGAAISWAVTGLMVAPPLNRLGAFAFNFYRQSFTALVLALIVGIGGLWHGSTWAQVGPLILSGFIGIFVGDTVLFAAVARLGPRRGGALFALNAPMAAILGWVVLGENLRPVGWLGVALCAVGVGMAVLGRPGRSGDHSFEAVRGHIGTGVLLGLIAALAQAVGSLIARPVMEQGFDPFTGSMIRVTTAAFFLSLLCALPIRVVKPQGKLDLRLFVLLAGSGVVAMVIGMSLLLFALQGGKVGIVSTLSALSPVFILPGLWIITGARPSATSWAGAVIAMIGMALIFS